MANTADREGAPRLSAADEALKPRAGETALATAIHRLFSFPLMLAAGLVVVAVLTVAGRLVDPDLWIHLKIGQIIWDTHSIPVADGFSFTANGHPWLAHEWLAQLTIYAAYKLGGYSGLMLWLASLTSILLVLIYTLCWRVTNDPLIAFVGAICGWLFATVGLAIRPLLLGHIFLVAELLLLELGRHNRRWLWLLPPLFAVWVNCHGSYAFGLGILCVELFCSFLKVRWGLIVTEPWDRSRRSALTTVVVLCGVALLCNPVGIRLLLYPFNMLFQQPVNLSVVDEWQPPDPRSGRGLGMVVAAFSVLLIPVARRSEVRLRELLLVAVAFGLAIQHLRMLMLFGIVVCPILCRLMSPLLPASRSRDRLMANALLLSIYIGVIIWSFPPATELQRQVQQKSPVQAVDYIRKSGLSGPMLNSYGFGGYLIWALPQEKVFIDGRGDIFEWTGVFREFARWATLSEPPGLLLEKYKIRFCLLGKDDPIAKVMPLMAGWRKLYSDEVAVVFAR